MLRWGDKRYYSLDYALKQRFKEKVYKIALNGNMTCPNRDGTLDVRGCIFCSEGGSGDFAASPSLTITEQIEEGKKLLYNKTHGRLYIAYFQAYTNTYAPVSYLRKIFTEALMHPDIVALSIATRPDCLSDKILELLCDLNRKKPVWIELGLQTMHESSAAYIRRGYPLSTFEKAALNLNRRGLETIVHIILGLPGESKEDMLATVDYLSSLPVQGIKLQLLHILKNTDLAEDYRKNPWHILTMEEYTDIIVSCLEHLSPRIVVHRITGDGPKNLLIAPLWSAGKKQVLNTIQHTLKERDTWQGRFCSHP
jgi:radical SAM protein (TIGR01212 family)